MRASAMTRLFVGAIGAALLSGCDEYYRAQEYPRTSTYPPRSASPTARTDKAVPTNARAQETEPTPDGSVSTTAADSLGLIGLDEQSLRSRLGSPSTAATTGPGKTWLYRNGRCTLNVFLYPDVSTRVYRTLSYEVTNDDSGIKQDRLCLVELQSIARSK